jgi:DNA-binding NarL/FixJ family response regulator
MYFLDLEYLFYYNLPMADPRKKKSSRSGSPQTNRYFHVLVSPLRLVNRRNPAAQENPPSNTRPGHAGGRRSTDRDSLELYDKWLVLSPRERQVTYLTCLGYKNEQIAFHMGVSAGTVKSYLKHVFLKMDVPSKTELRLKFHGFDFERNPP